MTLPALVASWSQSRVPSDEEIVRRVLAGETALFEVLMRRNNQRLYRAVRSVVKVEVEVEGFEIQGEGGAAQAIEGLQLRGEEEELADLSVHQRLDPEPIARQ